MIGVIKTDFVSRLLQKKSDISYKTYKDSKEHFSFQYPAAWQLIPEEDLKYRNSEFVVGVMRSTNDAGTALGVVVENKPRIIVDIDQIHTETVEDLKKKLKEFKEIRSKKIKISEKPALIIYYKYLHLGKKMVRQKQELIVTPTRTYIFSVTALDDRFSEYENIFDTMLRSVQVQ